MQNPRECALDVLIKVDKKEELSHIAISNVLEKYQFSEKRDRAFFTRLVEGTLERQITIDYVADQFSKTKIRKCKPLIRALLRMGIYQILYMDQVPDSAACNEAVKLAKKRGFSRLSGFVNGVLRNISRKKDEIQYPSREKNLETYLSVAYSIPEWIIKFFQKTYDNETVEKIIASYLEERKTTLCCLISKGGKEAVRKELEAEGVTVEDGSLIENAVKISDYDFLYRLKAFRVKHNVICYGYTIEIDRAGKFDVQRATEQKIPKEYWKHLQKGETVELDGRILTPEMVLGPPRRGIKLTYCTDTRPTDSIRKNAKGSDLFICEGMYGEKEKAAKAVEYKHMTFYEAANLAKEAEVGEMWLTHYSPSLRHPEEYMDEVRAIFPHAIAGKDRMTTELDFPE